MTSMDRSSTQKINKKGVLGQSTKAKAKINK